MSCEIYYIILRVRSVQQVRRLRRRIAVLLEKEKNDTVLQYVYCTTLDPLHHHYMTP